MPGRVAVNRRRAVSRARVIGSAPARDDYIITQLRMFELSMPSA
jgi:hypothetical protein